VTCGYPTTNGWGGPRGIYPSVRVLALSDEVDERLNVTDLQRLAPDLIVGCGDVPFETLGLLAEASGAPTVFVPGNHDPDLSGYRQTREGLIVRAGFVGEPPWPAGTINADGRTVEVSGVALAGLGGSLRYRNGPNQYTERQQARRVRRLIRRTRGEARRHRVGVNSVGVTIVITHAAPKGVGDAEDPPHQGFDCYHRLVRALRPQLLLHGHVNPLGGPREQQIGATRVVNVFDHRLIELDPDSLTTR
jgi:Calcineurin-like phosphoesterase